MGTAGGSECTFVLDSDKVHAVISTRQIILAFILKDLAVVRV